MTTLLNELNNNLETAKQLGDEDWQERLEKRIAQVEKDLEPEPAPEPKPKAKTTAKKGN